VNIHQENELARAALLPAPSSQPPSHQEYFQIHIPATPSVLFFFLAAVFRILKILLIGHPGNIWTDPGMEILPPISKRIEKKIISTALSLLKI
jgi:hypothetical protein